MKTSQRKIDWNNIKVTLIAGDGCNPQNLYSHLTPKERAEEIVRIAAKIWQRHVKENMGQ